MAQDFEFLSDYRVSRTGSVNVLQGSDNVRSAIENRLSVSRGSIPFRPEYGILLKQYQNEPLTRELKDRIIEDLTAQIRRDDRVRLVKSIDVRSETDGTLFIYMDLVLTGSNTILGVEVTT